MGRELGVVSMDNDKKILGENRGDLESENKLISLSEVTGRYLFWLQIKCLCINLVVSFFVGSLELGDVHMNWRWV